MEPDKKRGRLPMQLTPREASAQSQPSISSVHLNAIRGAAALVVLLGHTRGLFFASFTGNHSGPTEGILIGDGAVMIFFVLSGYLVGGGAIKTVRRGNWSWKIYLIKRFTRLWIVLLPALLLGFALDRTGLHLFPSPAAIYAGPAGQLEIHDVVARLSLQTFLGNALFLQTILVDTAGTNNSLWSLANEAWYYVAFPMALLAFTKHRKLWQRCAYLLATAAIALFVGKAITLLFFVWLLGAWISTLPRPFRPTPAKFLAAIAIFCVPVVLVTVKRLQMPRYPAEWIVALTFAAALYFLLHQTETAKRTLYPALAASSPACPTRFT